MGTMYWVRVVMMIITFTLVVFLIRGLQSPGGVSPIAKFFFLGNTVQGEAKGEAPGKITLCPTRVVWIETGGGFRLEQTELKWMRTQDGNKPVELDPDAVEKWFAKYCSVDAGPAGTGQGFQTYMRIGYVTGGNRELERSDMGIYSWSGRKFVSPVLDEGLKELHELPVKAKH